VLRIVRKNTFLKFYETVAGFEAQMIMAQQIKTIKAELMKLLGPLAGHNYMTIANNYHVMCLFSFRWVCWDGRCKCFGCAVVVME
jgi:hypothetical protein